jgi:hypothetical protein
LRVIRPPVEYPLAEATTVLVRQRPMIPIGKNEELVGHVLSPEHGPEPAQVVDRIALASFPASEPPDWRTAMLRTVQRSLQCSSSPWLTGAQTRPPRVL